jgi:Rhodopirellula transposase DDE domain
MLGTLTMPNLLSSASPALFWAWLRYYLAPAPSSDLRLNELRLPAIKTVWPQYITQNWRGRPLRSRVAIVELIGATTTKAGLRVESALDERTYESARRANRKPRHYRRPVPEWNYTIRPRQAPKLWLLLFGVSLVWISRNHRLARDFERHPEPSPPSSASP